MIITWAPHKQPEELCEVAMAPQKTGRQNCAPILPSSSTSNEKIPRYGATAVASTTGGLKREVGLFSAIAIVISNTIGSGILVSPSLVFRHTGTVGVSLLVWLAAGAMALIHALCMSELGTLVPASGGEYAYLCVAADSLGRPGDFVAFMGMWGHIILADPMRAALQSLTFTSYALTLLYPTCPPPYVVTVLVAVTFSTLATALNGISLGVSTKLQNILVLAKLAMLLSIIGTGIAALATGTNHMEAPFISANFTAIGLTEAYFAAVMSMEGGAGICNIGEEVKNPSQTIPCALILSSLLVTALYIFTNLAYFVVLEPVTIATADATALNFAVESWGTAGALIIPILASVSTFGTLSAGFFSHSRLGFAASRRGHLPSFLSLISIKSSVPVLALLFRGILTVAFATIGSVESVVNGILLISSFLGLFTPLAQIRLRITMKDVPRAVTVPYVFMFLSFAVNLTMIAINLWQSTDYVMLIILGAILLAGTIAYVVFHVNRCVFPGMQIVTQFLQKLLFCETCEKNVMNAHRPPEKQRDGQLSSVSGGHDSSAALFRLHDAVRKAR